MKFRPLHDRVVVRSIEEDMKTAGGIIIPDTAKEKPMGARRGLIAALSAAILGLIPRLHFSTRAEARG